MLGRMLELIALWLLATVALPFGVGFAIGHGGFAAAAFAALGLTGVLMSLSAADGKVMLGMSASFAVAAVPAYFGGRARVVRRQRRDAASARSARSAAGGLSGRGGPRA
jgi:hypothetical protein